MATGTFDANGVWNYGEDDNIAMFSDLLNLGTESTSDAFTVDRARIATVEANMEATSTFVAASATARNAHWGAPTTSAAQIILQNKGARTVRTDTGYTEQYHGVYHASTNPGGRTTAGWYPVPLTTGLVPIRPVSAVFVTGAGIVNSLGTISFNAVTGFSLNGIFTAAYSSYRLIFSDVIGTVSGGAGGMIRLRAAGVDNSAALYDRCGILAREGFSTLDSFNANATSQSVINAALTYNASSIVDIFSPLAAATYTRMSVTAVSLPTGRLNYELLNVTHKVQASYDGLSILFSSGTATGTLTVYGYNN